MYGSIRDGRVWDAGKRHISDRDRTMRAIMSSTGDFTLKLNSNRYASLVESIIFQQLAGKAANAILRKFKGVYGGRLPTPKAFLATPERRVRSAGISPQKYGYIKDLCSRIEAGKLELGVLDALPDEGVVRILDEVKGIGRWTAEMFLIFSLGRVDVVPFDDLGLRKAVKKAYSLRNLPSAGRLAELSETWSPYGTIATLYLWRSLNKQEE